DGPAAGRCARQARLARDAVSALHRRSQGGSDGVIARRVQRPGLPQRLSARLAARARLHAGSLSCARRRHQRAPGRDRAGARRTPEDAGRARKAGAHAPVRARSVSPAMSSVRDRFFDDPPPMIIRSEEGLHREKRLLCRRHFALLLGIAPSLMRIAASFNQASPRRWAAWALAIALLGAGSAGAADRSLRSPDGGEVRALVIGIDAYRHVRPLKGAVADARDI